MSLRARTPAPQSADRPQAAIWLEGRTVYLGRWDDEELAALAHDRAVLHYRLPGAIIHFPERAKALGPASAEQLRREARDAWAAKGARTSQFPGVSWDPKRKQWRAQVPFLGAAFDLGWFDDEREAALLRDRVARHLGLSELAFPARKLAPLSIDAVRERQLVAAQGDDISPYVGVVRDPPARVERRWGFQLWVGRLRTGASGWPTDRDAAIARDRAVLHYELPLPMNFPELARRLGAADIDRLRREARASCGPRWTSPHRGVHRVPDGWEARLVHRRTSHFLGTWRTDEEAAIAYDRAARLLLGDAARLNFPDRRLAPCEPAKLRAVARHGRKEREKHSRFRGVRRSASGGHWIAELARGVQLGTYDRERDAARAYDRAAVAIHGPTATLNFPNRRVIAATPAELREESRQRFKKRTTSRYVGVYWDRRLESWLAAVVVDGRRHALGSFDVEEDAAEAYDRALHRFRLRRRRNFRDG